MNRLKLDTSMLLAKPHNDIKVDTKVTDEVQLTVHSEFGVGSFAQYRFHDLSFSIAKNFNYEDFLIEEQIMKPVIWLHFNPVGSIYHHLDHKQNTVTQALASNIIFFRHPIEYEIHKNIPNTSLVISLVPDYLINLLATDNDFPCSLLEKKLTASNDDNILLSESMVTPGIQLILHEILNSPFHGPLKKLHIEGKVYELLSLRLKQLFESSATGPAKPQPVVLNNEDLEKIRAAKAIIGNRMDNPPSIPMLARQIGLNEFKLKNGFKFLFGKTIFGYLRDFRLETARTLIEKRELNITEIAVAVGYSNPAHFAAAFRARYGINPGQLLAEKRKSYSY